MTLTEILLATVIILIAAVAIIQFYISSSGLSDINREESTAMTHLISMMEAIKCTPFSNIVVDFPDGVPDGTASNSYATIVGGYELNGEQIVVSYVNPSSDPLEINVGLTWQDRRGTSRTKYLVTKRTK